MEAPMNADSTPIAADTAKGVDRDELDRVTHSIIGAAQKVSRKLGSGFLEKVYENALEVELRRRHVKVEQQRSVLVEYEGAVVGQYVPDLIVENEVVVEVKAIEHLSPVHKQQCMNYLRATGFRICLLLNFGQTSLAVRRIVNGF